MSIACYAFWLILNAGNGLTAEIALVGLPVAALVMCFMRAAFGWTLRREVALIRRIPRLAVYFAYLFRQVLAADAAMIRIVWSGRIDPVVFRMETHLKGPTLTSLLADSITLTPGTLTVETEEDALTVYALTERIARDTLSSGMADRVRAITERRGE